MWQIQSIPTPLIWWPKVGNPDLEEFSSTQSAAPVADWLETFQDAGEDFTEAAGALGAAPVAAFDDNLIDAPDQTDSASAEGGDPVASFEQSWEFAPDQEETSSAQGDTPTASDEQVWEFAPDQEDLANALGGEPTASVTEP